MINNKLNFKNAAIQGGGFKVRLEVVQFGRQKYVYT